MVTTIRMPDDLHGLLKQQAEQKGMTMNGYLVSVLWQQAGRVKRMEGRNVRKRKGNY